MPHCYCVHVNGLCVCCRCKISGRLATACGDDAIRVFEEEAGTGDAPLTSNPSPWTCTVRLPHAHGSDVNAVAWNPKVKGLLASCGDDGHVKLWQYSDTECVDVRDATEEHGEKCT